MAIYEQGSNIVIDGSVAGSLFPKSERDIVFPVLIDATKGGQTVHVEGAVYGRSIEMRGDIVIDGPVVSRGDTKLRPEDKRIQLRGGVTVNGILNSVESEESGRPTLTDNIEQASIIIRGDVAVNQSLYLSNAIVFGSIKAINCKLQNCIVLGTLMIQEKLTVSMSSIGGYSAGEVAFEGDCTMLHAIGESAKPPVFAPYEAANGEVISCDVRYYPAMRENSRLVNRLHAGNIYPEYSKLDQTADWVRVNAKNTGEDASLSEIGAKTVLSIGGRIGDFSKIQQSIDALTGMLKCGFEYDHLNVRVRKSIRDATLSKLNSDEQWILSQVCI
jgi:hypothetical protein